MPSCATLRPTSVRRWIRLPAAAADARFTDVPASATTCTATVSLLNSAGSSPPTTASARV